MTPADLELEIERLLPFTGVDGWLFWVLLAAFVVVVGVFCWSLVLAMLAERWSFLDERRDRRDEREGSPPGEGEDRYVWAFFVPALDEELTIADSITRLRGLDATERIILAIDDGSTDATPAILRELAGPDLEVLRREPPDARIGKAAALDAAWVRLGEVLAERGIDRDRVIVCVVDADGRLAPDAARQVARHFAADDRVAGVQVLVRIYNRNGLLTFAQDIEFRVMGFLFQAARALMGHAGMGGNGQFTRLVALDAIADERGPWRDTLTEDQDLGLRLLAAGGRIVHDNGTHVEQQGVRSFRALFRQRTRWSQGNLQAMALLPSVLRTRNIGVFSRIELWISLLMPLWQTIVGIGFVVAAWLLLTGQQSFFGDGRLSTFIFFYLLGFAGTIIGCAIQGWRTGGFLGLLVGLLVMHPYALYTWLLWPVLLRASFRQLRGSRGWAKTARERVDGAADTDVA